MAAVLVVDDDAVIRDVLYELFAEEHLCHTAESAEQALEFLESSRYDVAVVDISLPRMSGLDLMALIQQRWPATPVLIITGIDYQQYAAELLRMGAFDYIEKPFHLQDAKGKLDSAMFYRERWFETVRDSTERALKHGKHLMQERRASVRHMAQRATRLQFITALSDVTAGAEQSQSMPTLIGYTRDISGAGLALVVPCVRRGDRNFYGIECALRITLSLPTGIVELRGAPVRYEWIEQDAPVKGFIIGVRITGMSAEDRIRFQGFLGAFS